MIVNSSNNFCRVFEIPKSSDTIQGFLFSGGKPIKFLMRDWFQPCHLNSIGPTGVDPEKIEVDLAVYIQSKSYYDFKKSYLIVCDFGLVFAINTGALKNV